MKRPHAKQPPSQDSCPPVLAVHPNAEFEPFDLLSRTFVVFAKFSYSLRIRHKVQGVQVASGD